MMREIVTPIAFALLLVVAMLHFVLGPSVGITLAYLAPIVVGARGQSLRAWGAVIALSVMSAIVLTIESPHAARAAESPLVMGELHAEAADR